MSWYIKHSAKGSEWEEHKYLKKEGTSGKLEDTGVYYYPDDYKGGRHLPKGDGERKKAKYDSEAYKKRKFGNADRSTMEDWEKKVHEHVDKIIESNPDLFKSGADVARGIMDDKNLGAVKNTLKAFGVNVDKMSDDEIKRLRNKISSYYDKEATESGGKAKSKKSSKKEEKKEDDKNKTATTKSNKHITKNKNSSKSKYFYHSAVSLIDGDFLEHHGILGMHWGKRNGPPYPLSVGKHSASEKKAGWRKSLSGIFKKKDKSTSTSGETSKSSSSGASQPSEPAPKSVKDMTDEELNRALNRLRNEKAYNDLVKGDSGNKQNNDNQSNDNHSNDKNSYDMTWSKKMSDKEAQDYVNRLNNEKRYEELSQRDIMQGSKFAKRLIVTAGTLAATTLVTTLAVRAGQKAADKILKK